MLQHHKWGRWGARIASRLARMSGEAEVPRTPWVGAIDAGTTSVRFFVFDEAGKVLVQTRRPLSLQSPRRGWVEQDAVEMALSVEACINSACDDLRAQGLSPESHIKAIGITNQRETTIAWDMHTGMPLSKAIVWMDTRNASEIAELEAERALICVRRFVVGKIKWLLEHDLSVGEAHKRGSLRFGTVDCWLIHWLTGHQTFATDITNAHRTSLLSLHGHDWSKELVELFGVGMKKAQLPRILPSACKSFGALRSQSPLAGVPITGVIGDQQAALLGSGCLERGRAKITFGTGTFFMLNLGTEYPSNASTDDGLITTIAWQLQGGSQDFKGPVFYALEASIATGGSSMEWAKKNVGLIDNVLHLDATVASLGEEGSDGVLFVPALTGFLAPRWDPQATGAFLGLCMHHDRRHLLMAMIESIAFSCQEILEITMNRGYLIESLLVDGGLSNSQLLLQTLADVTGLVIRRSRLTEASVMGAARCAALGAGYTEWRPLGGQGELLEFKPRCHNQRQNLLRSYQRWQQAVAQSR